MRVTRIIAIASTVVALSFVGAASADNYGTSSSQASQMKRMIYKTFGTGYVGQCFIRIANRESGFNPRAANYRDSNGGSYGLLQLNGVHRWRGESLAQFQQRMWNPVSHLQAAKRLAAGGFGPWRGCP